MTRQPDDTEPSRRPPDYVIVVAASDWLKDRFPAASLPERCPARRLEPLPRPRTRPGSRTMTLTIHDTTMTSDQTAHTARQAPSRNGWEVSWLPGQTLDRNTAITAMTLADLTGEGDLHEGHRLWPHVQGWAAELGLTGPEAVAAASQPPSDIDREHEPAEGQPDPEAAD